MKSRIPWAIWMDKWCQNELKWRLESHEQYGWTNDAKMNSNMKTWIPSQQYGWTNDAKMNTNGDLNPMSNIDGQMMPKWTQMNWNEDLNPMSNMDGQMMPKWTQMKTWISWAIWMDKWCQNELKWRLESHEQYWWTIPWWWTDDSKMNSNEDSKPMSNMAGQKMLKWTQMKTWKPWAIWMDKFCQNELKWRLEYHEQYGWTNDANDEDLPKWTNDANELKWRVEYHEQYGWTNDAKMNSNEDLNPMSNIDGQMMPKWTQMKSRIPWVILMQMKNLNSNLMTNMDGQMMPKWTKMKTWIPWAILMDKWCQNELKWTQMKTWISWAIWMDKWCQN